MIVPSGDQLLGFAICAIVLLVIFGAPRQVVRSMKRWLGGEEPQRPPPPETRALVERMRRMVQPTLLMTPAEAPGFSKLGGSPDSLPEAAWPQGRDRPLIFLAQVDLTDAAAAVGIDWLPKSGRLFVFHEPKVGDGADVARVVYGAAEPTTTAVPPKASTPYRERRVAFRGYALAPSLEWLGLDGRELDLHPTDFGDEFRNNPPTKALQHRIGGYPDEIQDIRMPIACEHLARGWNPPAWGEPLSEEVERAASDWRLLLQFDSDPELRMTFGDGGRLYILIRERDARAGDFSKTVTIQQSH